MKHALFLTAVIALLSGCSNNDGPQKTLGTNSWRGFRAASSMGAPQGVLKTFDVSGALSGPFTVDAYMGNLCQGTITFTAPAGAATAYDSTGTYTVTGMTLVRAGAYPDSVNCSQYAESGNYVHRGGVFLCKGAQTINCEAYQ